MRKGAEQIVEAAFRFDMGLDKLRRPDGHEAGRKWFPSLVDRLHLGAVIAKCGVFCAQAEDPDLTLLLAQGNGVFVFVWGEGLTVTDKSWFKDVRSWARRAPAMVEEVEEA